MNKLLLTLLSLSVFSFGQIADNQIWHAEKLSKSVSERSTITLEQDLRSKNNGADLYYFHGDIGYHYAVNPTLSLALSFREVFENKNDVWTKEHRPHAQFSLARKIANQKVSIRNRIEYRILDGGNEFRNRSLATVTHPLNILGKSSVYTSDEVFFEFADSEVNRNRFYLGFNLGNFPVGKLGFYTMWQTSLKNENWTTIQVTGLKWSL